MQHRHHCGSHNSSSRVRMEPQRQQLRRRPRTQPSPAIQLAATCTLRRQLKSAGPITAAATTQAALPVAAAFLGCHGHCKCAPTLTAAAWMCWVMAVLRACSSRQMHVSGVCCLYIWRKHSLTLAMMPSTASCTTHNTHDDSQHCVMHCLTPVMPHSASCIASPHVHLLLAA